MNNIWLCIRQELWDIPIPTLDRKPIGKLLRHEQLAIADSNNFAPRDPLHLSSVAISDLAAADNANLKHETLLDGSLQKKAPVQLKSALSGSIPVALSTSDCCNGSISSWRTTGCG